MLKTLGFVEVRLGAVIKCRRFCSCEILTFRQATGSVRAQVIEEKIGAREFEPPTTWSRTRLGPILQHIEKRPHISFFIFNQLSKPIEAC